MKKYIYSIVLSLTIIWSCSDDDYSRVYVDNEIKTEIVGAIEVPRQAAAVGTMVAFNYTLPQSFEVESTIEVTAKSAFGILDINANKSISYITVPAGTTTGTAYFEMPGSENDTNNNYNGIEEYATVSLTGIALTQPEEGSIDDPYTLTSNQESVTGLNLHSNYMSPNDDILTISLDWQGPWDQNDFDLYIDNAAGDNFESVETGSRFEGVYFNETEHPYNLKLAGSKI